MSAPPRLPSLVGPPPERSGRSVRTGAYPAIVVELEFHQTIYWLTYDQAKHLAESLRNYGKAVVPEEVEHAIRLGGSPRWTDGALAVADFIEEILVESLQGPLPLEGKAAEATFWALRLMPDLGRSLAPSDMAALRDALGSEFAAGQTA
jgi:hypothetical protein